MEIHVWVVESEMLESSVEEGGLERPVGIFWVTPCDSAQPCDFSARLHLCLQAHRHQPIVRVTFNV